MKYTKTMLRALALSFFTMAFTACEKEGNITNGQTEEVQEFNADNLKGWITEAEAEAEASELGQKSIGEVRTVPFVDLARYTGRWFELAKFPTFFGVGCTCTTAEYGVVPEGVSVFNNCFVPQSGINSSIEGIATVADAVTNAKLKVQFPQTPFPSDYWIIDLIENEENTPYEFSVVSNSDRTSLFILSRKPQIKTFQQKRSIIKILIGLISQGYDLSKIELTPQSGTCVYP